LVHQATDEEINNAYRRLSRMYHPDKHSDVEKKTKAEHLFNKTKKIYEILRDPHKRAIYDTLGIKGLEVDGWELVERAKTPAQIREEYERLAWYGINLLFFFLELWFRSSCLPVWLDLLFFFLELWFRRFGFSSVL
jgi:curved DNA-binding protein CbpA